MTFPRFSRLALVIGSVTGMLLCSAAQAQWQTTAYTLKGGWNAIFLSGDAKYAALDQLFPPGVVEVWRWNSNPTQVQFITSPSLPSAGTPEWSVWKRGLPSESTLSELSGQASYLIRCTGTVANTYTVALKQSPLPPSTIWVRNGANLLGFPSFNNGSNYPQFSSYFATFPAAIAANTKVYKYVGGDLGPANPVQIFSTTSERLDRTQAYWFSAEVVQNFYAPLEISLSTNGGLAFGRTGSIITARIRNRSASSVILGLAPGASEAAPASQTAITGPVPLTRRTFDTTTLQWIETPITGAYSEVVGPQSTIELNFGIDRTNPAMTGAGSNALFASFLRLTDNGNLMDINLPVTAAKASLAGLWIGDAKLSSVSSKVPGSTGSGTPAPFPLRILLHVDNGAAARLLSQVYVGQLAAAPNDVGICTLESLLKQDAKAGAQRFVAAHLPLDQVITSGSGAVAIPGTLVRVITVPYNDPTNPFVHQYHPDHDNKDARFNPIPLPNGVTATTARLSHGVEAPAITRTCTFTFTSTPPAGSDVNAGWGSSVIGGTYSESISGLHKEAIEVSGTFELRRASENGTIAAP